MDIESAQLARRNGKYRKAIELYKQAITEDANNATAYAGLGLSHAYLKEKDDAIAMANKALQLDHNQPLAHIALAGVYHSKGQLEQYKNEIEKAFALDPFFYEVACAYAKILFNDKKIDEAFPIFEKIAEFNADKVCPRFFIGLAYSHKKQFRNALNEYIKAFGVQPSISLMPIIFQTLISIYWPWSNIRRYRK